MLTYPASIPLSTSTLTHLSDLLRSARSATGTRWRRLDPGRQALLVLAHLRNGDTYTRLATGFGIGVATVYRYIREAIDLLAATAPTLDQAVHRAARLIYVILDDTLIPIDRIADQKPYYPDRRTELATVESEITTAKAAIVRYLTAFEKGTMSDTTCAPRIADLEARIVQLQTDHDRLTDLIDTEPTGPTADTLDDIRAMIHDTATAGTPTECKQLVEAMVAEIRITDGTVIPVYRLPEDDETPADESTGVSGSPVRTMVRSVGRTQHRANRSLLIEGDPLPVTLINPRRRAAVGDVR